MTKNCDKIDPQIKSFSEWVEALRPRFKVGEVKWENAVILGYDAMSTQLNIEREARRVATEALLALSKFPISHSHTFACSHDDKTCTCHKAKLKSALSMLIALEPSRTN